ncbi:hypothetical protein PQX77_017960 [Marasmius sp. AFHP31]|nr:hypothetical protein PQX77_017960 [Marasmius sp. AFHP31]
MLNESSDIREDGAQTLRPRAESKPDGNEVPPALIIACVLGAILFLVTSISLIYWWLSRTGRWPRKPMDPESEYPFSSPEAVAHPTSSMSASASTTLAGIRSPESESDEIFAMRPVGLDVATPSSRTIAPASGSQNRVWDNRNPYYTSRPQKSSRTGRRKHDYTSSASESRASASTSNSHGSKRRAPRRRDDSNCGDTTVSSSAAGTQTVSSISFAPATERQMELAERIEEMQGKLALFQRNAPSVDIKLAGSGSISIAKMTHDHRVLKWQKRIEKLIHLKDSDWALGLTDELPPGLLQGKESDDLT